MPYYTQKTNKLYQTFPLLLSVTQRILDQIFLLKAKILLSNNQQDISYKKHVKPTWYIQYIRQYT